VALTEGLGEEDETTSEPVSVRTSGSATTEVLTDDSVTRVYEGAAPSVVQITTLQVATDPLTGQPQAATGLGSGFILDREGHIVTNYHVVAGSRRVSVSFSNNDSLPARVVGSDPSTDLAVLKVDASEQALKPLPLGDSDQVRVGQWVAAIGNPLGLDRTVTAGIVSALNRQIQAPNGYAIPQAIQTDAPINQGNSGGPLLDLEGTVIGVNSQIATAGSQGNIGIGFAVPSNMVKKVSEELIATGRVAHAYLGIGVQELTSQIAKTLNLPVENGLLVEAVEKGSAAAKAGLRAGDTNVVIDGQSYRVGGDILVSVDGRPVETTSDLLGILAEKKPGDRVAVEVYRDGERLKLDVTLGRQPTRPGPTSP
jgi:S1-C subfamily serine protease